MPNPLILRSFTKNSRLIIAVVYLIVLMLALISSHSRMGLVAAILGLVSCYFFANRVNNISNKAISRIKFFSAVVLLILFAVWFGLADIVLRYTNLKDGNLRFEVWHTMVTKVPIEVWFYGAGPGSFGSVFEIIKPSNFTVRFIYAHNDYLEFVFEFGLLLSILILFSLIYWLKCNKVNVACSSYLRAGVYASFIAIGFHSIVDFNMQIPASALCFWIAFGLFANSEVISYDLYDKKNINSGLKSKRNGMNKPKKIQGKKSRLPKTKQEWIRFFGSD